MKNPDLSIVGYLIGLALLFATAAHATPITVIDQQNQGNADGTNGGASFGQSFTPTLPAIDAIEFQMFGLDDSVVVKIRHGLTGDDGLNGPIIATSESVNVLTPTGQEPIHFDFLKRISLIPGDTYVAQLFTPDGVDGVSWTSGNTYAGGQFLQAGFKPSNFQGQDLIFIEGMTHSVPSPGVAWLFSLGLVGLAFTTKRNQPAGSAI